MEDVRWTKTAGIVFASRGGEEQDAMWPWRLSAQIARTMKEVGNAEHENECVPERRFTRCSEDKSCLLPRKNSIPLGLID